RNPFRIQRDAQRYFRSKVASPSATRRYVFPPLVQDAVMARFTWAKEGVASGGAPRTARLSMTNIQRSFCWPAGCGRPESKQIEPARTFCQPSTEQPMSVAFSSDAGTA